MRPYNFTGNLKQCFPTSNSQESASRNSRLLFPQAFQVVPAGTSARGACKKNVKEVERTPSQGLFQAGPAGTLCNEKIHKTLYVYYIHP